MRAQVIRTSVAFLSVFLISCSTLKINVSEQAIEKHLPGTWEASKGTIHIGCDGGFTYLVHKPYPTDISYNEIKGATIKEYGEDYLLIETFPFRSEKFEMKQYPTLQDGVWIMRFYETTWKLKSNFNCPSDPGDYLKGNI